MRQNRATSAPFFYCVSYEILCETRIKPSFFGNCLTFLSPALGQLGVGPLSRLAATASRLLALSVTAAAVPAPPKGEPSRQLTRGLQKAKSRLPLWGALVPSGHRSALDRAGRRECHAFGMTERARCQRPLRMGCVEALASCPLSRLAATASRLPPRSAAGQRPTGT